VADYPDNIKYTKEHEWVKITDNVAIVGITEYAAEQLGDVVHVELPQLNDEYGKGDSFGVIESVKSVSDVYLPMTGRIIDVNELLVEDSGIINEDPYGEGWVIKVEISNTEELDELLTSEQYQAFLSEEA